MLLLASWQPVPRLDPFCSCRYHRESKTDSREFSHSSLSSPLPLLTRRFLSNRIEFDILFDSLSSIISSVRRTVIVSLLIPLITFYILSFYIWKHWKGEALLSNGFLQI